MKAQNFDSKKFTPVSPTGESIDKYDKSPINPYTGLPSVEIPIYGSGNGGSVNLSYHASGAKPDESPSWVGQGWSLGTGGAITRRINGQCDEWKSGTNMGYYDNRQLLGNSDWSTQKAEQLHISVFAEPDLEPDEFKFNVDGYSGTFFLNHQGNWVFKTNDNTPFELKGVPIIQLNYAFPVKKFDNDDDPISQVWKPQERIFYGFTLINVSTGVEYVFGGSNETVEFSYSIVDTEKKKTPMPMTWHLKEIRQTNGVVTTFKYQKDGFIITTDIQDDFSASIQCSTGNIGISNCISTENDLINSKSYTVIDPSYITSISNRYEKVLFKRSTSTASADYVVDGIPLGWTVFGVDLTLKKRLKLDAVEIYSNSYPTTADSDPTTAGTSVLLKTVNLTYKVSPSNRLLLETITEKGSDNTTNKPPYTLIYDETAPTLPNYNAKKSDHWGYFNNKTRVNNFDFWSLANNDANNTYFPSREPDNSLGTKEVLTQITYPTGGYTTFEYEAHGYSSINTKSKNPVTDAYSIGVKHLHIDIKSKPAGGIRIKKIKNNDGAITRTKEYLYVDNYSPTTPLTDLTSSGILSAPISYVKNGQIKQVNGTTNVFEYIKFQESSYYALNATNDSHVTYTQVVEKNEDNSYSIYKFSSNDNTNTLFKNKLPNSHKFNYGHDNMLGDVQVDYSYTRGKLLWKKDYNSTGVLVHALTNDYVLDATQGEAIRAIRRNVSPGVVPTSRTLMRTLAYEHHTYPIFLSKTTDEFYYTVSNTPVTVSTQTDYVYGSFRNLVEQKTINSDGKESKKVFYYKDNLPSTGGHPNLNTTEFTTNRMMGIMLESRDYYNSILTGGTSIAYQKYGTTNRLFPFQYYQIKTDGTRVLLTTINTMEDNGLPKTVTSRGNNNALETYVWEANAQTRLLSKKIQSTVSPTTLKLEWVYDYNNKGLLSCLTNENGLKTKYEYDNLLRLSTVQDRFDGTFASPQSPQTITTYTYHYKGQATTLAEDVNRNFVGTSTAFVNTTSAVPLSIKQYSDGLGRPFLTYKHQYAPNSQHQKNYVTYDILGRTDKMYQPFANATQGVDAVIPSSSDFKQTIYEASPLSRPIKQIAEDGQYVEIAYSTNLGSGTEGVKKFVITYSNNVRTVTTDGYYEANTLSKTTVWDENGQSTFTEKGRTDAYTDKLGRVVLTRKYVKNAQDVYQNVETYNVYDDFGDLVMVIPPGAINSSNVILTDLVFEYQYDSEHRLTKKKVPNADEVCYFYNNRGLLALMQDGNMRLQNKYLGTVYDDLGRVVKTGFVTSNNPNSITISDALNDANRMTQTLYYPNSSWVQHQEAKVLNHSDVPTIRNHIWSYIERRAGHTYTGNPIWTGKQHLLSETYRSGWSLIANDGPINDDDYGGVDWSVSAYDGLQKPTLSIRYLFSGQSGSWQQSQEVRQSQTFMYDNGQRLAQTNYMYALQGASITATPQFELSNMTYNERDLLTIKKTALVGNKYLQSTNFAYNRRNWLAVINGGFANSELDLPLFSSANETASNAYEDITAYGRNTPLPNSGEHNPDLFRELIRYANPFQIPASVTTDAQYNGNISQIEYQVAGDEAQAYSFKYDNLDRLIEANYADIHSISGSGTPWANHYESDKKFQEKLTYDLRGNIQSLTRRGTTEDAQPFSNGVMYGNFGSIDNLTYHYNDPNNSNKLTGVTDASNVSKGFKTEYGNNDPTVADYTYDENGNITSDLNKGITNIQYNYLNLPTKITCTNPVGGGSRFIYFVYDASGQKHQKIVKDINCGFGGCTYPAPVTYTYVNGIEYKNDVLQRIAHTEGSVALQADGTTYAHEYVIKDHLGNTRVTYRDDDKPGSPLGTIKVDEIVQINHQYPFGLNMEGNWNGSFSEAKNKYQFGGKELNSDFGLEWNDFGKRFYDPSVNKWWNIDSKSEKYYSSNPYNYVLNNPIINLDPNGDSVKVYTELISAVGYTARHAFMRVQTDKVDVIIELWGPSPEETARATGQPHIDKYDEGKMKRTSVKESNVTRPADSPEGNYNFENKILELANFFSQSKIDTKTGKIDYPNVPEYGALGPNSNGYVNFLITNSGGKVDLPINAIADGVTLPYQTIIGQNKRSEIQKTLEKGKKVSQETQRVNQESNKHLKKQ